MLNEWIMAALGGALIGVSASLMLFLNGRVAGMSGILNGTLAPIKAQNMWRWFFVAGLLIGGFIIQLVLPQALDGALETESWTVIVAGLLVGFGTIMGSGCTSGHGVCGISRLSPRSFVATGVFILAGIISVVVFRKIGVLP